MEHHPDTDACPLSFWRTRYGIGFIVIGSVAAFFLITEHWEHVAIALPYLLLLACPLMHVFMHGGHGNHSGHHHHQSNTTDTDKNRGNGSKPGDRL